MYRQRNLVERCLHRLKQYPAFATGYAKRAQLYKALVIIVGSLIWLK